MITEDTATAAASGAKPSVNRLRRCFAFSRRFAKNIPMFTILYIYFKRLRLKTRITIGLVVAVVLFSLGGWLYYYCYLADTLVGYVPADATLYFHLNWPQQKNLALAGVYDQIAKDLGLEKLDWSLIRREAAVICLDGLGPSCVLLARTYDGKPLGEFTLEKGLPYRRLAHDYLAIGASQEELGKLARQKNRLNREISKNFSCFDSFGLYLSNRADLPDIYAKAFLSPLLSDGPLFINGKTERNGVSISLAGRDHEIPEQTKQKIINDPGQLDFDLIANFSSPGDLLRRWENVLAEISPDDHRLWQEYRAYLSRNYKISASSSLAAGGEDKYYLLSYKKNNSKDKNFLLANDFLLLLPLGSAGKDQAAKELESSLQAAFARVQPQAVSRQLSDGTEITEYLPQTGNLDFAVRKDYKVLAAKNTDFILAYKLSGDWAMISNKPQLIEKAKIEQADAPYLRIKSSLLPGKSHLSSYLGNFKQFLIFGGQVIAY